MKDFHYGLELIGILFLAFSVLALGQGFYNVVTKRGEITEAGLYKCIGVTGLFIWGLILVGTAGWLVAIVFSLPFRLADWKF